MNTVGIFTPIFGFVQQIPVNTGSNGFVEIINGTNYNLKISIFGLGDLYQFGRSQAIYKLGATQGAQTIQLAVTGAPGGVPSGGGPLSQLQTTTNPVLSGDNIGYPPKAQILLNSYQEGEIEWYPPFGLADPVFNTLPNQYAVTASYNAAPTPVTYTLGPLPVSAPFVNSFIVLCGFDLTVDNNSTSTAGNVFSISGTQVAGSLPPLEWLVVSYLAGTSPIDKFFLSKTFTPPIISYNNASLTFTVNNVNGAGTRFHAYYYGIYN